MTVNIVTPRRRTINSTIRTPSRRSRRLKARSLPPARRMTSSFQPVSKGNMLVRVLRTNPMHEFLALLSLSFEKERR
jgi:hypothetical protein